jgi:hypothetical protein
MSKRRELLLGCITAAISVGLCLLIAEVALRFLPVATGMRTLPVTAESPVFRFAPDREFVYSRDWDMAVANRGHVNNAGFVNDRDYRKDDPLPLMAVIGDSMIEAAMVPFRETVQARLAEGLAGRLRVYSFAAAGAPMSQYLIWARHAVKEYGAQALVISVVSNDYDQSHSAYYVGPGYWHYVPDADGTLRLRMFEYRPGLLRNAVYVSALARYLVFNLQVGQRWIELKSLLFGGPAMAAEGAPVLSAAEEKRVRDSIAASRAFLRDLAEYTGLPPSRILLMVEGFRYPDAAAAGAGSYFDRVRRALLENAASLGYDTLDLDPYFFEHYRRTGQRVEFARDGHWTGVYHGVAYEAVMKSPFMARLAPELGRGAAVGGRPTKQRHAEPRPGMLNGTRNSEIIR